MEGTPFGRYRLLDMIGRGGMGEVWRAYDTDTDRTVAIKMLPAQFADDDEFTRRFRREARLAAGLRSPNVVPIHDFGEIDGRLYVEMALVSGRDLQAVLADGPIAPERAVRIVEQVAAALRDAHAAGLVHRDVKPSNVLLTEDDFAYLIDFGIARSTDDAGLTMTGHPVGTLAYMAPERFGDGVVDARTDVYSLACVLFQCLTGRRPFAGTGTQQMLAHVASPPPRPSESVPNLSRAFDAVIAKGMAKDVWARHQTIDELARAARAALEDAPAAAVPEHTQPWVRTPAPGWQPVAPQSPGQGYPAPGRPWWRRAPVLVAAILSVVAVSVAAIVLLNSPVNGGAPVAGSPGTPPADGDATYSEQLALPSNGLTALAGIATTGKGDIVGLCCAASPDANQVFRDEATGDPPRVVPLAQPTGPGIAVDDQGNGYVAGGTSGVLRLDGALRSTPLPFPPMHSPTGVAVDATGAVYVVDVDDTADSPGQRVTEVWKLAYGATAATKLPFDNPAGYSVAVDRNGTAYVESHDSQVILKLELDATRPTGVPLDVVPRGIAVDGDGDLYVAASGPDGDGVYVVGAGTSSPERLPIDGVSWNDNGPVGIAVDQAGNVYVADQKNDRIVKLPRVGS